MNKTVSLNSSFVKRALNDKTFMNLSSEIMESNKAFYLNKLLSVTVYSIWHFLGEPTSKKVFFSREYQNCNLALKKSQFFKKLFDNGSLVQLLEKKESFKKVFPNDSSLRVPKPEQESKMKALHDPMSHPIEVETTISPKKMITDCLEKTPDYLNFHPNLTKNVLIQNSHLLSEEIISKLSDPKSMINLDEFLNSKSRPKSETFFETILSPSLSALTLKMHILSILLSKQRRTAFGLAHLDIDPQVS